MMHALRLDDRSSPRWFLADEDQLSKRLFDYALNLERDQISVHHNHVRNAKMYGNCDLLSLDRRVPLLDRRPLGVVTENVIQSVCDTATAMIAKNRPRPVFMTDGADFDLQRRAKKLERYMEGVLDASNYYRQAQDMFRDATIFGTGMMFLYARHGRINIERAFIDEILVDEQEAYDGRPRQIIRRRPVDKWVLANAFPNKRDMILESGRKHEYEWAGQRLVDRNEVMVLEAWRLPSGPGADDGRHSIVVEEGVIFDECWEENSFPFVWFHWSPPLLGFYGQGLADQLSGLQRAINELNRFITISQRLIASPRIFVDVASKIMRSHIESNEIGKIIPFRGRPPIFSNPQSVGAEIYAYKEQLKRSAYEIAGISQLSAQSKKPLGLDSGEALRELTNRESDRFAIQEINYEEMILDVARTVIWMSRKMQKGKTSPKASYLEKNFIRTIKWSDVDLDDDRFRMRVQAASIMSRTPAARQQQIKEWSEVGLIPNLDTALRLMDHPDLQAEKDLITADVDDIQQVIMELTDPDAEFPVPDPFQNLPLGLATVRDALLKVKVAGYPEETLERFRTWLQQAEDLVKQAQKPGPEPGTPMPPPEGDAAMAQPQLPPDAAAAGAVLPPGVPLSSAQGLIPQ